MEPKTPEEIEIERWLDKQERERQEWARIQEDLYPGIKEEIDE